MKNAFLVTLAILFPILASAEKLEVDPNHSTINFQLKHLGVSKIPGRFTEFKGAVELNEKNIAQSKVDFSVQTASINTSVSKRDDHLRSADFFDVQKFPEATFKSTSMKKSGKDLQLTGDLTIRGVTKSVSFKVQQLGKAQDSAIKAEKTIFHGTGKINRKDFGVSYGPDALISDQVDLEINLETIASK